jgi:hypothetical protein
VGPSNDLIARDDHGPNRDFILFESVLRFCQGKAHEVFVVLGLFHGLYSF